MSKIRDDWNAEMIALKAAQTHRERLESVTILLDYVTGEIPDVKQQGILIAALDEIKYQLTQ